MLFGGRGLKAWSTFTHGCKSLLAISRNSPHGDYLNNSRKLSVMMRYHPLTQRYVSILFIYSLYNPLTHKRYSLSFGLGDCIGTIYKQAIYYFLELTVKKSILVSLYICSLYSPCSHIDCTILYGYGDYIGSINIVTDFRLSFLFFFSFLKAWIWFPREMWGWWNKLANYHLMFLVERLILWLWGLYREYIYSDWLSFFFFSFLVF